MKRKMFLKTICVCLTCSILASSVGCSQNVSGEKDTTDNTDKNEAPVDITILTTGNVNTPTDANDPYKKYILDKYNINLTLIATDDFSTQASIKFNSDQMPDIICFPSAQSLREYADQGVLIDDWTPYLDKMPNVKDVIDGTGSESEEKLQQLVMTKDTMMEDGKLKAIWTQPQPTSWSLKIRQDWLLNLGYAEDWYPKTDEELLEVARRFRNEDPDGNGEKDTYAFTSSGEGKSFGTLGQYIALMYGYVPDLPWGIFVNKENKVDYGVYNGSYKGSLDFIKKIVEEDLIEPNWYYQAWTDKVATKKGKIGIEWYPGVISEETQLYNSADGVDTLDWWITIPIPKADGYEYGGKMPSDAFYGKILSCSVMTAANPVKMEKILQLINDVTFVYDDSKEGSEKYRRSETYDALRWGIGVEKGLAYQDIEGKDYKYIDTSTPAGTAEEDLYYRERFPGAWDYGAWFVNTNDGIVQGDADTPTPISLKVIEHDQTTAAMQTQLQVGGLLKLNGTQIEQLTLKMHAFEYKYVNGDMGGKSPDEFYAEFLEDFKKSGGDDIMKEAEEQFKKLGIIH